jgi:hypothetical protein
MHTENGDEFPSSTSGPERTESIKSNHIHATALSSPDKVPGVYCIGVWTHTTRDMHKKEVRILQLMFGIESRLFITSTITLVMVNYDYSITLHH